MKSILRKYLVLLGVPLLSVMSIAPASGQTAVPDSTSKFTSYQLSDLSSQSQKTSELSTKITQFVMDDAVLKRTSSDLEKIYVLINELLGNIDTANLASINVADQSIKLRSLLNRLNQYSEVLAQRTKKIDDFRKELATYKSSWQATMELAQKEEFPPEVRSNIDETLKEINKVDELLVEHLNKMFVIINRNLQEKDKINATLAVLNKLEKEKSGQIFSANSPPIWKFSIEDLLNKDKYRLSMFESSWISLVDLEVYGEQNVIMLVAVLLVLILFYVLVLFLRKRQKGIVNLEESVEYRLIFKHPIELSMVLAIILLTPSTGAPPLLGNIVLFVVFVLVTRIISELIHPKMRMAFIVTGVFLFINPFFFFRSDIPWLGRLILLLESIVVMLVIWKIIKKGKENFRYFGAKMIRVTLTVLSVIMFLVGLAGLANLLGLVTLSKNLLYGSIRTVALGISFYAAALILFGVVKLILNNPGLKETYMFSDHGEVILKRFKLIINLIFAYSWLQGSLESFSLWKYIHDWLVDLFEFTIVLGRITIQVQGVIAFFLTGLISWWLANLIEFILKKELIKRFDMPRGVPNAISATIYYAILVFGFFMAISQTGIELSQLSIILGALSVGVGFGLQSIIANFISGIILVYERPVQVGDKIEVGTMLGDVTSIGVRASKIRTFDGSEVVVPNSNLISNELTNWTLSDQKKRNKIEIGVAYGNNPRKVARLLEDVARKYDKTLKYPSPLV